MKNLREGANGNLVTTTIRKREVIYYLVNEDDLNSVKSKSWLTDLFMLLASLAWGAYLSVIITRSAAVQLQEQAATILDTLLWIFGIAGLVFTALAILFLVVAKSAINRIKESGKVEALADVKAHEKSSVSFAAPAQPKLRVIQAVYGTTKNSIDVTAKLNELIRDATLSTTASNELGGDPDKGTPKILKIKYDHNGVVITKEYKEHDLVKLP